MSEARLSGPAAAPQSSQQQPAVLQGGRTAHRGGEAGVGSGEGPSQGAVPRHKVTIYNHFADQELEVEVPQDRCESSSRSSYLETATLFWAVDDWGRRVPCPGDEGCNACQYTATLISFACLGMAFVSPSVAV